MAEEEVFTITESTTLSEITFNRSLDGVKRLWIEDLVMRHLGINKGQFNCFSRKTISQIAKELNIPDDNVQILLQEANDTIQNDF